MVVKIQQKIFCHFSNKYMTIYIILGLSGGGGSSAADLPNVLENFGMESEQLELSEKHASKSLPLHVISMTFKEQLPETC
jgi:hypothetical protein